MFLFFFVLLLLLLLMANGTIFLIYYVILSGIKGSSDGTLKLWRGKTCVHTFVGHTGWSYYFCHTVFFSPLLRGGQLFLRYSLV